VVRGALAVLACLTGLALPAAEEESRGDNPPGARALSGEEFETGPPGERKDATGKTPEPRPDRGPGRPAPDPESRLEEEERRIDERTREIQRALLEEIIRVEERVAAIRMSLELELGIPVRPPPGSRPGPAVLAPPLLPPPSPGQPAGPARKAARRVVSPPPGDAEDDRRHRVLLGREAEIVERWKELGAVRGGPGDAKESSEGERAALRSELRQILREILDLRERARERQVERLRKQLDDVERALKAREAEEERDRLVKARMREILEQSPGR
jgi:hypothetical protein